MRRRPVVLAVGVALPVVALAAQAPGCRTPTQVTLDVETNVVCADMRGVDIVIAADAHEAEHRAALDVPGIRYATATTTDCAEGAAPRQVGTLVVTPGGGDGAVVVVAAFGSATTSDCMAPSFAPGCIVARRRFSFVDHQAVTLPIVLDPICAGIPCNENSTCVGKKCVDSKVDCTTGTCGDPGQRTSDGGLVEVDAFSPLDAAGGVDASDGGGGVDAAPDGASDGSIGDGAPDAPLEGSADAGGGSCPLNVTCAGSPATACVGAAGGKAAAACCYATDPATCSALGTCSEISGCCRSSDDCPNPNDICCASTTAPISTTTVVCKPRASCTDAGGRAVCSMVGSKGCGDGGTCLGFNYSMAPDYYGCS